jgi:hypothetical protein
MRRNTPDQVISCHLVSRSSGEDVTTGTAVVYITIDGGDQFQGAGAIEHEGNGDWSYWPLQAETNGRYISFTFVHPEAISQTVGVYTSSVRPPAACGPDLLAKSSDWLAQERRKFLTQLVTYLRQDQTQAFSLQVPAAIGQTTFQTDDGAGALIEAQSRDYLICVQDLSLDDGTIIIPRRGDQIVETVAGQEQIYEVSAPGAEPAWRYSDPYHRTYRVHTKQVEQETSP